MRAPDVTIVGLGPAGLEWLPAASLALLRSDTPLLVRTERHPAVQELAAEGRGFRALDATYDSARSFESLYRTLAEEVATAGRRSPVLYAVPGHPLLGEESVRLLLAQCAGEGLTTRVLAAPGFVDVVAPALAAAGLVPELTEWQVADAAALERVWWDTSRPVLLFQVDDAGAASRAKLALQQEYPDAFEVWIVRHAGEPGRETVVCLPLYQLDRPEAGVYDHLCTVYVPPLPRDRRRAEFRDFVDVVARLRAPDGCPWDREQTHASLKKYLLEESYEVLEAIDLDDPDRLCDEMGDVLLQVLLHSQIAAEEGVFDVRDVIDRIVEKLIRRHPHVFAGVTVDGSEAVVRNWDEIKRLEKPERTSVLDGVPRDLPALMKAVEVSKRVVCVGFEWPHLDDVFQKLDEELRELKQELVDRNPERLAAELGDLLFTVVNVARWLKVDPEDALRRMLTRFETRFRDVERRAEALGKPLSAMDIRELDVLWEQAKAAVDSSA